MSEKNLKVGQKVEIVGKNVTGEIAFVGMTTFATGKWVGVILNEPVGKNNGSIKGTVYFTVRQRLLLFLEAKFINLSDVLLSVQKTVVCSFDQLN